MKIKNRATYGAVFLTKKTKRGLDMKSLRVQILLFLVTTTLGTFSYAGGCFEEHVTYAKDLASHYMANLVRNKVLEIEKKMNAKGEKIHMVFVARRGENMDGLQIYKDDPNIPLGQYLYELYGALQNYQEHQMANNEPASLPSSLFEKGHLRYSHMGILLRTDHAYPGKNPPKNHWVYISHLLAHCSRKSKRYGSSNIFTQKFPHFFWDTKVLNPHDDSALIIVPSPKIQARFIKIFENEKVAFDAIHEPKYNVAAVPFRFRRPENLKKPDPFYLPWQVSDQNSDQWPLELIAAAELPADGPPIVNRVPSQEVLWKTNYRPTIARATGFIDSMACTLRRGPFLPWGGQRHYLWDASNLIDCFDQVFRGEDIYELVTVRSVINYLERNHLMADNVDKPGTPGVYEVKGSPKMLKRFEKDGKTLKWMFNLMKKRRAVNYSN